VMKREKVRCRPLRARAIHAWRFGESFVDFRFEEDGRRPNAT